MRCWRYACLHARSPDPAECAQQRGEALARPYEAAKATDAQVIGRAVQSSFMNANLFNNRSEFQLNVPDGPEYGY
ncbi:hypothetical protein CHELA40_12214 [Chelatococcus asaccharovorans]|nr:hypothetical protein CHELA40_12214 [Chelatococcus asaccharovorans]CAH1683225.1 hypothetical protein CHELA17_63393 [Chelatococcus asaccharovorans]